MMIATVVGQTATAELKQTRRAREGKAMGSARLEAILETASKPATSSTAGPSRGPLGPIVFFDGVCGFCNRFVDFVIRRDTAVVFRFAPLQGETARRFLPDTDVRDLKTVVLWEEQGVSRKSTAVVRVLRGLGGAWRVIAVGLRLIPRPLRDLGYALVARYRYAIFGKKETCRMPTAAERSRFLP
jgi:predicted DCC family thiol-disulfide oxidoreductase YuxK